MFRRIAVASVGAIIVLGALGSAPSAAPPQRFWSITGNSGLDPTTSFLGTTDAVDLVFRTDGVERARILAGGGLHVFAASPGIVVTGPSGTLQEWKQGATTVASVGAAGFAGNGAGLTNVTASGLADGTYGNAYTFDNARNSFSGSGAGLANVTASGLAGGTYGNAYTFGNAANTFSGSGAGLTNVTASGLAGGTYGNAYTFDNAGNSYTGSGAGLTNLSPSGMAGGTFGNASTFPNAGNSFTGSGAGLTNVTASGLASGTYRNAYTFDNAGNSWTGTFSGSGTGLTNLNASNLSSGTVARDRLLIDGYFQLPTTTAVPPAADCDEDREAGRATVDIVSAALWICLGARWASVRL